MVPLPQELTQIRRGYTTRWNGLVLSVESIPGGWVLSVRDESFDRGLYRAQRLNLPAAKAAAVEFALFQAPDGIGRNRPEQLASQLEWQERW